MRRRLVAFFSISVLVGASLGAYVWLRGVEGATGFDRGRNGIWLDVVWVNRPTAESEVAALVGDLSAKRFRYAYVYVNSVEATGQPTPATYRYAAPFVLAAKRAAPELQLIAWVGVLNQARGQGKVPIDEEPVRANIAAYARELTRDLGFDGVQLNVEPLPNGSEDFLYLLRAVRAAIGPGKSLSVAGHKWSPDIVPKVEEYSSYWKSAYYRAVASLVDQVAVMTYDSYAPNADTYRLFQREQTLGVLGAVAGTGSEVLIGVPTYYEPRPNHNPEAENMETGLRGVNDALHRLGSRPPAEFAGVALYAHWETDEQEWATYRSFWLDEP